MQLGTHLLAMSSVFCFLPCVADNLCQPNVSAFLINATLPLKNPSNASYMRQKHQTNISTLFRHTWKLIVTREKGYESVITLSNNVVCNVNTCIPAFIFDTATSFEK